MAKKNVLGKGLGALLQDAAEEVKPRGASSAMQEELKLDDIRPNPNQPRTVFDEDSLNELATSIKSIGIVQPITVRELSDGKYEIVAGERRYRASRMAGLTTIPAYIRKVEEDEVLELALIENIQREDLNAIEIAFSYQRLIDECRLTQDALSERVGKNRTTISNYLRLLRLPAEIQLAIKERLISMGHARAIINIEDTETQFMIFEQILKYDFSVRKVEEIVRELTLAGGEEKKEKKEKKVLPISDYVKLEEHLSRYFGSKVDFKRNEKGRGKIVISFKSDVELERIVGMLDGLEMK